MSAILAVALLVGLVVPQASQLPPPLNETPSQFYMRYRKVIQAATSIEQITALWSEDQRRQYTEARERATFQEIKNMHGFAAMVKVVKESATPTTATLELEAQMPPKGQRGTSTIRLVREQGGWKVATTPEQWQVTP